MTRIEAAGTTIPISEGGLAHIGNDGSAKGKRVNSARPTALRVSNALGRLLPFPEHPDLDHLRTLVKIAFDEALSIAYRSEPTEKDLEYIRHLEQQAKIFAAPRTPAGEA